jgi:hypothetical protein
MNAKYRVAFYEHESGWGSRLDSEEFFETYEEASKRVEEFNAHNNKKPVPDWYMTASEPQLVDLDRIKK